jgi:hypothetical protein
MVAAAGELFQEGSSEIKDWAKAAPIYESSCGISDKDVTTSVYGTEKARYAAALGQDFHSTETSQQMAQALRQEAPALLLSIACASAGNAEKQSSSRP